MSDTYVYERSIGGNAVCRYELRRDGDGWRCDYTNPPHTYASGTEYGSTPEITVKRFCVDARDALLSMVTKGDQS